MPPFYKLQIITPQGVQYQNEVVHALIPAEDGFVGVLANHAPYITSSLGGSIEIREKNGEEKKFQVGPGFFEVSANQAAFLAQTFRVIDNKSAS
jgi:F-type H+-transporting ATPase subunit epsilon